MPAVKLRNGLGRESEREQTEWTSGGKARRWQLLKAYGFMFLAKEIFLKWDRREGCRTVWRCYPPQDITVSVADFMVCEFEFPVCSGEQHI